MVPFSGFAPGDDESCCGPKMRLRANIPGAQTTIEDIPSLHDSLR
jgi:hypothetical protein